MGRLSWEDWAQMKSKGLVCGDNKNKKEFIYCETKRSEAFCNMRKITILSKDDNERYCRGKSFHCQKICKAIVHPINKLMQVHMAQKRKVKRYE